MQFDELCQCYRMIRGFIVFCEFCLDARNLIARFETLFIPHSYKLMPQYGAYSIELIVVGLIYLALFLNAVFDHCEEFN